VTDHIEPLRVIRQRLAEVTESLGLELRDMDVRVAADGHDMVLAVFTIDLDQVGRSEEAAKVDDQIAEMERQMVEQAREESASEARENLENLFGKYRRGSP
jgi:hypothetical protein